MGSRLYCRDSYGRDRRAARGRPGRGTALPARFFVLILLALAILMVLASIR